MNLALLLLALALAACMSLAAGFAVAAVAALSGLRRARQHNDHLTASLACTRNELESSHVAHGATLETLARWRRRSVRVVAVSPEPVLSGGPWGEA